MNKVTNHDGRRHGERDDRADAATDGGASEPAPHGAPARASERARHRALDRARVLRVALDTPLRRLFDYLPPRDADAPIAPGMRVEVPFGTRTLVGLVAELATTSELPLARLKAAHAVLDSEPVLDATTFELVRWAADYYHHPVGEAYAAALPTLLRAGRPLTARETRWQLTPIGLEAVAAGKRLGPRQRALVEAMNAGGGTVGDDELENLGAEARDSLRTLVKRGWVESFEIDSPIIEPPPLHPATGPTLTSAQDVAVREIGAALGGFAPFLLHGVTGSGKTEVYLRIIERALERGQQALVLVPEIGLTPQAVARFRARFGVPLAVLHSGLTGAERLAMWRAARDGSAPVVIGTRSAIFVPLPNPGVIVVDEEHDTSYKQQDGFRYSARDLAVIRAQRHGVPVVLGSATPSLETLHNANAGRYRRVDLPERAGAAGKPRVAVVDLRVQPQQHGIATPVAMAMQRHLDAGAQVLLYLNRRGFAPTLFCPNCSWSAPCEHCDARMTVHRRRHVLACHHCGAEAPVPYACPVCSTEVKPVGQGTERIEDALDELFPGMPVVRVDRDTIRKRGEIEAALDKVHSGEARILVGTQMLTKGHDFPDVTLVAVLNADQGLFGTDFRSAERLAQTIVQVAGRAGRASRPGEVLVQSACPDNPLLKNLLEQGYDGFAAAAFVEREAAHWPPYSRLAVLRAEAGTQDLPMTFLTAARDASRDLDRSGVRLLGPAPAAMERRAGRWRAQLLLESTARGPLQRLLGEWLPRVEALPEARRVRWSIDVDPLEVT